MLRTIVKKVVNLTGYEVMQVISPDMDKEFLDIYKRCKLYTVTSIERMFALYEASKYVVNSKIEGDIVECGVWKGGSSMLCALTLKLLQETQRKLYLYDTFEGMTEPTEKDVNYKGEKAVKEEFNKWCSIPLEDVLRAMVSTDYPHQNFVFVKGKVEDTIPRNIPEKIALLRLDTDFYESTYHEMVHLFPRLVAGGVLIIDDYGHFKGAREAVDKYLRENNVKILLNRIDYTGRIGVKI
jgi:O-methyltransferase